MSTDVMFNYRLMLANGHTEVLCCNFGRFALVFFLFG